MRSAKEYRRIFDVGGNVGNLFYCYPQFASLPPDLLWTVLDLPDIVTAGRQLAAQREANALRFTERFADGDGADLTSRKCR